MLPSVPELPPYVRALASDAEEEQERKSINEATWLNPGTYLVVYRTKGPRKIYDGTIRIKSKSPDEAKFAQRSASGDLYLRTGSSSRFSTLSLKLKLICNLRGQSSKNGSAVTV